MYKKSILFTSCFSIALSGAPGDLDPSFGPNGNGISVTKIGRSNSLSQMAYSEGIGFYSVGEVEIKTTNSGIGRYTTTGILDASFNGIGYQRLLVGSTTILNSVAVQNDGKAVVAGYAFTDRSVFIIARYNTDGSLDQTFGNGGYTTTTIGTGASINGITIQPDGKIIVCGCSNQDIPQFVVARYMTNGALDTSFGTNGITLTPINIQSSAQALTLQSDGKIVVTGYATDGFSEHFALTRYLSNGTLDSSFGNQGVVITSIGAFSHATAIGIQSNGNIIVGGYTTTGYLNAFALTCYDEHGNLNTSSFNETGIVVTQLNYECAIHALVIDGNDNIIVGGYDFGATETTFALARYTPTGILDTTFGSNGMTLTSIGQQATINSLILENDGKIVAGGFSDTSIALARYFNN